MRLEDINQEFPKMPEDMRAMVEKEVEKQMKQTSVDSKKRTAKKAQWSVGRAAAVALAATMALGTTVYAGVKLYQMRSEPEGEYGLVSSIDNENDTEETKKSEAPLDIPMVKMEATYIPEGMSAMNDDGIFSYNETPFQGGFSVFFFRMDMGDDAFKVLDKNVISSEEISLNGHDGVYFVKQGFDGGTGSQHIYLAYPEVHYVLDLYIGMDVAKEEALKFAEGIRLTPTEDEAEIAKVRVQDWSNYLEIEEENAKAEAASREEGGVEEAWLSVSKAEFEKNVHKMGKSISMYREWGIGGMPELNVATTEIYPGLEAKVTDVKVTDNLLSVLPADKIESDVKEYMAEDGSILPFELNYIKSGDGIHTIDEVVKQEKVTPKFVYTTVEYTNHGTETLEEVLVNTTLLKVTEEGDNVVMYQEDEKAKDGEEWDLSTYTSYLMIGDGDVTFELDAKETERNYILNMKPGETATLHVGFFVTEDALSHMYLNVDPYAVWSQFSDTGLDIGYVDIRQ